MTRTSIIPNGLIQNSLLINYSTLDKVRLDLGVELVLRVFARPADLWTLRPALTEQIKLQFDQRSLIIPYPQLDVHMHASVWDLSKSKQSDQ